MNNSVCARSRAVLGVVIAGAVLAGTAAGLRQGEAEVRVRRAQVPPGRPGDLRARDRVAGVPGDPLTFYAAFAQGGVWKSENGGRDWKPIFDEQPTNSIGSIAVAPSDPNVIYVGTGEANIRGNVALRHRHLQVRPTPARPGSTSGRRTARSARWRSIRRTRTSPLPRCSARRSAPNKERGVYRTTDGGKTWQQVLFKDDETGASDVAFDPNNPRIALRRPVAGAALALGR